MEGLIEILAERIWIREQFQKDYSNITNEWLARELGIPLSDDRAVYELVKCMQAATILAGSADFVKQRAAYSIAACVHDLRKDLPGVAGVFRIILTKMGNFPAFRTANAVSNFSRLPTSVATLEEIRRGENQVKVGRENLIFTDFQRKIWDVLCSGKSASISAPTSAGKSFVLQAYLRKRVLEGSLGVACYLVPSRALIAQVSDAIGEWRSQEELHNLAIVNIPLNSSDDAVSTPSVHVLTQERLQATLSMQAEFAPDLIICDEAQSIQEGARGILLQNVVDSLLARNPKAQIIFIGPNIRNPEIFSQLFDVAELAGVITKAPSVLQNLIVVNTRSVKKGDLVIERLDGDSRVNLGSVNIGRNVPSIKERLVWVSERFGKSKPSIVYANRPVDAEDIAEGLSEVSSEPEDSGLDELVDLVKIAVHEKYSLGNCLRRRVGFHYGRIPALVRRGVEAAFAEGKIKYLVTTSTLIQGVNFPAGNLFLCKPRKGQSQEFSSGEFWNLAGRAGRLGKEFQGNIFLIDYHEWTRPLADESKEVDVVPFLDLTISESIRQIEECAIELRPTQETPVRAGIEAVFSRLLSEQAKGTLPRTLARLDVSAPERERLTVALTVARGRIKLPDDVVSASLTVSPLRQQILCDYLEAEILGGGTPRLEQLIPRHPRDPDAFKVLCEVYRICHEQILSLKVPKLHIRMAAISLRWMRGDPIPEIIDENHKRMGGKLASSIRTTLSDIEEEIRFKYMRLTSCYLNITAYVLKKTENSEYLNSLSSLPIYLEMGASDETMISFIGLGLSRLTARMLTDKVMDKEMGPQAALQWLRSQDLNDLPASSFVRADIQRALLQRA